MQRGATSSYANVIAGMQQLVRGKTADAEAFAHRAIQLDPKNWYGYLLLDSATGNSVDANEVSQRYLAGFPELGGSGEPTVTDNNFGAAIDLAAVLARSGNVARSNQLLDGAERLLRQFPLNANRDHALAEVQILALRGRPREAIARLRAPDRPSLRTFGNLLQYDPLLASLHGEPEFKGILMEYQAEMARQRAELAKRPKDAPLDLASLSR